MGYKPPARPYCGFVRNKADQRELAEGAAHVLVSGPTEIGKTRRVLAPATVLWGGPAVVVGTPLALLYQPTDSLAGTVLAPWLLAQLPAALLTAGIYGILEGWLAVDGARDWWPMRPPPENDEIDFGLEADDLTMPGVFGTRAAGRLGERTPIRRDPDGL